MHGTTTRQARHRKTGIKARQRAILAEAHAKKRFPRRSLFKVLSQADNIASALGNAQPRAKAAGTLLRRALYGLYGYYVHNATHALRGLTHSPPFPAKRGMAGSGHSPANRSLSLCPRSRGVKTKSPVTTHPGRGGFPWIKKVELDSEEPLHTKTVLHEVVRQELQKWSQLKTLTSTGGKLDMRFWDELTFFVILFSNRIPGVQPRHPQRDQGRGFRIYSEGWP